MVLLSATVFTSASKRSESHRTVIKLHSGLTSGLATSIQLYKMLEWSNESFRTQSTSTKGLVSKSQQLRAVTEEEKRAAALNLAA